MPRGYPAPPELRAECITMVMTGVSVSEVARQHGLHTSMVARWVRDHARITGATPPFTRARDPEVLENLIYDLVAQLCISLRSQLQAASQPAWLAKQEAGQIAQLLGIETERLIRLLAGFRPVETPDPDAEEEPDMATARPPDPALN